MKKKEENPSTGNFLNAVLVLTLFIVSIIIFVISNKNKYLEKFNEWLLPLFSFPLIDHKTQFVLQYVLYKVW